MFINSFASAQHTFVAIAEFSGIIILKSYFRLAENNRLRSPQQPQARERWQTVWKKRTK